VKGVRIRVIDAREVTTKIDDTKTLFLNEQNITAIAPSQTFYFEGGLLSLIKFHTQHDKPVQEDIFYVEKQVGEIKVEISFQYIDDISAREMTFTNNTSTPEGGTHLTGFRTALTRTLNAYARKNNFLKEKEENFTAEDVREGLVAAISVQLPNPQFEGQTKAKLGNVEVRGAVEGVFGEALNSFLEEKPNEARAIVAKVTLALKARKAAKAAKDSILRKGALEGMTLPGKLSDCQTKDASEAEVFIVEGDSAGGSGKQGRDRRIQAILPLRGKILNVERARLDKMLAFNDIKNLVIALGTSIGDSFDISKLRYHKVIIATDADVDGAHIRTLLLTLFYRYLPALLEQGHIYIAQPPLYKIKKGKEIFYAYSDAERNAVYKKLGVSTSDMPMQVAEGEEEAADTPAKTGKLTVQRYKGLGEMNADELWETTMDPARRVLKRVSVAEAAETDKIFVTLMGDEVEPRKLFIQTHAKMANLDV
jgi:DNA gyrase subunit B